MKKLFFLFPLFLVLLTIGCEKNKDDDPNPDPNDSIPGDINLPEGLLTTLEQFEDASAVLYQKGRFMHESTSACMYRQCHSDLIKAGSNLSQDEAFNELVSFSGMNSRNQVITDLWDGFYEGLEIAVNMIQSVQTLKDDRDNNIEDEQLNKYLGLGLFFRAYFHKSLVERWENIVLMSENGVLLSENVTLSSKEDVYQYITNDLYSAIEYLPERGAVSSPTEVSKAAARQLLALAFLDLQDYSQALSVIEDVVNDPALALLSTEEMADIFSPAHQDNSEIIFSWEQGTDHPQLFAVEMVGFYDRAEGVSRTFDGGGRPFARLLPSDYYWTLFTNEDARLEAWHKRFWTYDVDDEYDPLPDGVELGDTVTADNFTSVSGNAFDEDMAPTTTKYWEDETLGRTIDNATGYKNIIQYRYAQTLLIAAEAAFRTGNAALAQQYLDQIRYRAGVQTIPVNIEAIVDEEARELAFEGHRSIMLRRLGIFADKVSANPFYSANFIPAYEIWPIPQIFIDEYGVTQNPGY